MSLKSAFASKVHKSRKALKLTQAQAAETFNISIRWYQKVEKGTDLPGNETMLRMMIIYELNPQDFRKEVGL